MIIKSPKRSAVNASRTISAGSRIASQAKKRGVNAKPVTAAQRILASLTPEQRQFTAQLQRNMKQYAKRSGVTAATNTSNIAARPDFIELLPLFTQNLLVPEVLGTVAMNSRQQLIPYFKVKTSNTKGETPAKTILSTPFVNRQGVDPNFGARLVRNETVEGNTLIYVPILPNSVTIATADGDIYTDDGAGNLVDAGGTVDSTLKIDYASGMVQGLTGTYTATYQYDNETIGPDQNGEHGAKMGKLDLELDEIMLVAEAHELACYYSVYASFAAQNEYGATIEDLTKEAAFSELTAEINSQAFRALERAAAPKPQFDWDASPILSGSVVPSDYLNMFELKLNQAAASIYQTTRLAQPNKIIAGTSAAAYMKKIEGFQAESNEDAVGPYKAGRLNEFEIYVDPNYDVNKWVMCCKNSDIRRSSAIFGEYMPFMATDPVTLADMSQQAGFATMYDLKVVNPGTIVSGQILGTF